MLVCLSYVSVVKDFIFNFENMLVSQSAILCISVIMP